MTNQSRPIRLDPDYPSRYDDELFEGFNELYTSTDSEFAEELSEAANPDNSDIATHNFTELHEFGEGDGLYPMGCE